ncbi:MAG: DEAD/DEAH box helicase [Spirochaetaceae bacterium]|nr:DEAD/DEAH box helicase [Spirochaetaceae bacterium]
MDEQAILDDLLEGGRVAKKLGSYEERASQLALLSLIIKGFNEGAVVVAEAGTGVGKSFAYLLPAVHFVLAEKRRDVRERVVISTATINLQQQLFDKDIPFVLSALGETGETLKAVLVKGRGNYLCLRRLHDALREAESVQAALFEEHERGVLQHIAEWAGKTKTGSKTELPFSGLWTVWPRVCSETDSCMGKKCPERMRCFVQMLRREAAAADVLVVNHHLLFADLAARADGDLNQGNFVLPPYSRVIIDEAHNIESAATSFFSEQFSPPGLLRTIGQLYRKRLNVERGLLVRAASVLNIIDTVRFDTAATRVREAAEEVSGAALELCGGESAFRITAEKGLVVDARLVPLFVILKNALGDFAKMTAEVATQLGALVKKEETEDEADGPVSELVALSWEIASQLRRVDEVGDICTRYITWQVQDESVLWVEKRASRTALDRWTAFNITPLEIASRLKDALWDKAETAVLVSATLTVADTFQYFFRQSGLDLCTGRAVLSGSFPSPFPYKQTTLLAVPNDAPLPNEDDYRAFVDETVEKLCEVSGGRALILFTSYESMNSAYAYADPLLDDLDITCYKQGDDDRARLLETFKKEKTSVLFATDSFWEGIDAPGETLSLLVIARLPFRMPGDPVFEARCEAIEQNGGNAFMQLSIPEAVMKFRQGFGRLIRGARDRGVVAVLDGRLVRKYYGSLFLQSLPETKTCFAPSTEIIRAAETFFFP